MDWLVRRATLAAALAAIGRVSRAGCADWASEGSDAARRARMSDWCCGAALGHPASRDTGWI